MPLVELCRHRNLPPCKQCSDLFKRAKVLYRTVEKQLAEGKSSIEFSDEDLAELQRES